MSERADLLALLVEGGAFTVEDAEEVVASVERELREKIAAEMVEWARSGILTPYGEEEGEALDLAARIARGVS